MRKFSSVLSVVLLLSALALVQPGSVNAQFGFIEYTVSDTFLEASSIYGANLDDDDDMDIFAGGIRTGCTSWFENDGNMQFTEHVLTTEFGPRDVKVADIDGDGDMDPYAASWYESGIHWWENIGGGEFTEHSVTDDIVAHTIDACDLDGDEDMDILCAAWDSGFFWYENNGSEQFTQHFSGGVGSGGSCVRGVDVDSDGDMDMIGTGYNNATVYWWENGTIEHVICSDLNGAHWIDAADYDGDGDTDLVCAAYNSSRVEYFENDGSQGFTHTRIISFGGTSWIQAIDMDMDDDYDILVSAEVANEFKWLENIGPGLFAEHDICENFGRAFGGHGLDMDNDNDIDVLGAALTDNRLAWWENDTGMAKALEAQVTPNYGIPGEDTFVITAEVFNPDLHELSVTTVYSSMDETVSDIIDMYDDGQHDDGEADDNIWGSSLLAPAHEDVFTIDVFVEDTETGTIHPLQGAALFATAGPVVFENLVNVSVPDTIITPGESARFLIGLRNSGETGTVQEVAMTLTILDTLVQYSNGTTSSTKTYSDIAPGGVEYHNGLFVVSVGEEFPPDTDIHFEMAVSSLGEVFWTEEITFHVSPVSDADERSEALPSEFQLHEPYPNPFNSQTRISVDLPVRTSLTVKVFDVMGREVSTLMDGVQEAGQHNILFRPDAISSGTYFVSAVIPENRESIRRIVYVK